MCCSVDGRDMAYEGHRSMATTADFVRREKAFLSFQKPWMRYQRKARLRSLHDCAVQNGVMQEPLQSRRPPLRQCQSVGFGDELE